MNIDLKGGLSGFHLKGEWPVDMPEEVYFLKYAFPCAFVILQRGKISQGEYDELEKAAVEDVVISRERLEGIFVKAFERMGRLVDDLDVWKREVMQEYYWKRHNEIIDAGEGDYAKAPAALRELCKILPVEVVRVVGENAVVKFECGRSGGGKTRAVSTDLVGPLKAGDRVMIHYGYAVEKLL